MGQGQGTLGLGGSKTSLVPGSLLSPMGLLSVG